MLQSKFSKKKVKVWDYLFGSGKDNNNLQNNKSDCETPNMSNYNSKGYGGYSSSKNNFDRTSGLGYDDSSSSSAMYGGYSRDTRSTTASGTSSYNTQGKSTASGFYNYGNTCYMNATLQAFRPAFKAATELLGTPSLTGTSMISVLQRVYSENDPSSLINYIKRTNPEFDSGKKGNSMVCF